MRQNRKKPSRAWGVPLGSGGKSLVLEWQEFLEVKGLSYLEIPIAQHTDRHLEDSWKTDVDPVKAAVIFWGHLEHRFKETNDLSLEAGTSNILPQSHHFSQPPPPPAQRRPPPFLTRAAAIPQPVLAAMVPSPESTCPHCQSLHTQVRK